MCRDFTDCFWYNFDTISTACILNADCTELDTNLEEYITGEVDCPFEGKLVALYQYLLPCQ